MPGWLMALSWVSVVLGLVTATAIAADVKAHPQGMPIMNIVWPVTGLYTPVFGYLLYRALGRPMAADAAGMNGEKPFWKSIFLSATHCGSGCVLGDIIGAPIVLATGWTLFGERLFAEYVAEFAIAYLFGIAFQYFPIRSMRDVSPAEAIRDAVKADSLSLIAFEVGMFGWMALVWYALLAAPLLNASTVVFWFMMQIGMVLGFCTTYPANALLIRAGIKGGM
jgi:hypothetical protein